MTALIETMRVRGGAVPLLWFHRLRLERSAAALGLPAPALWPDAIQRATEVGDGVLRVVWNGVAEWSTREVGTEPVALRTSAVPHTPYPHKTTGRDVFVRAARAAGGDEPLLLTADRQVAETAKFAVVWLEGETLCAVDLAVGVLPSVGIERLGRAWPLTFRRPSPADLADRPVAVVNAVRGLVPVTALDGVSCDRDARWEAIEAAFWPA
jgi:branched-subunit amino acid aminotransferase/4-amino-4-deoxychorismate lyase